MKIDTTVYPHTVAILVFAVSLGYLGNYFIPAQEMVVTRIELFQSLWLLFGALFTWCYIKPWQRSAPSRAFWLWSISWWILLFGRGISWGRDYFPDVPKLYFRLISIALIGVTVGMTLWPVVRREITRRLREEPLPVWDLVLLVLYFLLVDTIEHHRLLAFLFVSDVHRTDLLEELFELPFMFSLLVITWFFQKKEKHLAIPVLSSSVVETPPRKAEAS